MLFGRLAVAGVVGEVGGEDDAVADGDRAELERRPQVPVATHRRATIRRTPGSPPRAPGIIVDSGGSRGRYGREADQTMVLSAECCRWRPSRAARSRRAATRPVTRRRRRSPPAGSPANPPARRRARRHRSRHRHDPARRRGRRRHRRRPAGRRTAAAAPGRRLITCTAAWSDPASASAPGSIAVAAAIAAALAPPQPTGSPVVDALFLAAGTADRRARRRDGAVVGRRRRGRHGAGDRRRSRADGARRPSPSPPRCGSARHGATVPTCSPSPSASRSTSSPAPSSTPASGRPRSSAWRSSPCCSSPGSSAARRWSAGAVLIGAGVARRGRRRGDARLRCRRGAVPARPRQRAELRRAGRRDARERRLRRGRATSFRGASEFLASANDRMTKPWTAAAAFVPVVAQHRTAVRRHERRRRRGRGHRGRRPRRDRPRRAAHRRRPLRPRRRSPPSKGR